MSHRVCAKILEFVFGRSIATKSLEEVRIVTRLRIYNFRLKIQSEILFPVRARANSVSHCRKGEPHSGEKFLIVERLGEKSRRASFERSGTNERIIFTCKHDYARRRRKFPHPRLDLKAVHERHPNINDGNRRPVKLYIIQKQIWIAELFGVPTCRHEKPIEASQHGRIVVEKTD